MRRGSAARRKRGHARENMECHRVQVDVLTASHANRSLHFRLMYGLACFVSHFRFLIMQGKENDSAAYLPDSQIHRASSPIIGSANASCYPDPRMAQVQIKRECECNDNYYIACTSQKCTAQLSIQSCNLTKKYVNYIYTEKIVF